MHILRVDGTTEEMTDNSLEAMQKAVGGYIEEIGTKDGRIMIINEEGKLENLPFNKFATDIANIYDDDYIVGNVIIADEDEFE